MPPSHSTSEIRWTVTDRGFKHYMPIVTSAGQTIRVYESSAAESPHLWLDADGDTTHVTLEEAELMRDAPNIDPQFRAVLAVAIERHYQTPGPDPADWKAGDPCAMCGSTDTTEEDDVASCRSCGASDNDG